MIGRSWHVHEWNNLDPEQSIRQGAHSYILYCSSIHIHCSIKCNKSFTRTWRVVYECWKSITQFTKVNHLLSTKHNKIEHFPQAGQDMFTKWAFNNKISLKKQSSFCLDDTELCQARKSSLYPADAPKLAAIKLPTERNVNTHQRRGFGKH